MKPEEVTLFKNIVLDLAERGWEDSLFSEARKIWCCGQLFGRLPEVWINSIFNAALEGLEEENTNNSGKLVMLTDDEDCFIVKK